MARKSHTVELSPFGEPALAARLLGWTILSVLFAFLVNNVLIVGFGYPGLGGAFSGQATGRTWVQVAIYAACVAVGAAYVLGTRDRALRRDAAALREVSSRFRRAATARCAGMRAPSTISTSI